VDLNLIALEEANDGPLLGFPALGLVAGYDPYGGYEQLACNDDSCGDQSLLDLPIEKGETYHFVVTGYNQNEGDYTLTLSKFQPYPLSVSIVSNNAYVGNKEAGIGDEVTITAVFSKALAQRPNATIAGRELLPAAITGSGATYEFRQTLQEGDQADGDVTFEIRTGNWQSNEDLGKPYNIDPITAPVGKDLLPVVFDGTRPTVAEVWMVNADYAREGRVLREALPAEDACYSSWDREAHEAKYATQGQTVLLGFNEPSESIFELAAKIATRDAAPVPGDLAGVPESVAAYATAGKDFAYFPNLWNLNGTSFFHLLDADDVDQGDINFEINFRDRVGNFNAGGENAIVLGAVPGAGEDQAFWMGKAVVLDTFAAELEDVEGGGSPSAPNDNRIAIPISPETRTARDGDTVTFKVVAGHPVSRPPSAEIAGAPAEIAVVSAWEPASALDCIESTVVDLAAGTSETSFDLSGYAREWQISRVVTICEWGAGVYAYAAHDDCHAQQRGGGSLWVPLWNEWCWEGFGTVSYSMEPPRDWAKNIGPSVSGPYSEDYTDEVHFESPVPLAAKPRADVPAVAGGAATPTIVEAYMQSNNRYPNLAKAGDTVTLTMFASDSISAPNVTIAGRPAKVEMGSAPSFAVTAVTAGACMDAVAPAKGWQPSGAALTCTFGEQRCLELAAEACGDDDTCEAFHAEVSLGGCARHRRRRLLQTCEQSVAITYFKAGAGGGATGCTGTLYERSKFSVHWKATAQLTANAEREGFPPLLLPWQDDGPIAINAEFESWAGVAGVPLTAPTPAPDGCFSPAGVWLDTTPPILESLSVVSSNSCGDVVPEVGKNISLQVVYNEPLHGYGLGSVYIESRPSEVAEGNFLGTQNKELGFVWQVGTEVNGFYAPGVEVPEKLVTAVHSTVIQSASGVLVTIGPVEDLAGNPGFGPWKEDEPHLPATISGDLNDIISGDLGGDRPPPDTPFTSTIMTSRQAGEPKNAVPGTTVDVVLISDVPVTIDWGWLGSADNIGAAVITGSGNQWTVSYTFTTADRSGPIQFKVGYRVGECGSKVHRWLMVDEERVIYDKFMPQVTTLAFTSDSEVSNMFLRPGQTIGISYTTNKLTWGEGGEGTSPRVEIFICGVLAGEATYTGPGGISDTHAGTFTATEALAGAASGVGPCRAADVRFTIHARDRAGNLAINAANLLKMRPSTASDMARLYFDNTLPSVSSVSAGVAGVRCANSSFTGPGCDTSNIALALPGNWVSLTISMSEPVGPPAALVATQEVPPSAVFSTVCEDSWGGCAPFIANASTAGENVDAATVCSVLFCADCSYPHLCDSSCSACAAPGAMSTSWDVYYAPSAAPAGPVTYTLSFADPTSGLGGESGVVEGVAFADAPAGSCAGRCGGAAEDGSCSCAATCREEKTCCADAGLCCLDLLEETDRPGGCLIDDVTPPRIRLVSASSSNSDWNNRVAIAGDTVTLTFHTTEPTTRPRVRIGGTYLASTSVVGAYDTPLQTEALERAQARALYFTSASLLADNDEAGAAEAYDAYLQKYQLSQATHRTLPEAPYAFPGYNPPRFVSPYRNLSTTVEWTASYTLPSLPKVLPTAPLGFKVDEYYEASPNELYQALGHIGAPLQWNMSGVLVDIVAPIGGVLFVNPPRFSSVVMTVNAMCCYGPGECSDCDDGYVAGFDDEIFLDFTLTQGVYRPTVVMANVKIPDADQPGATITGASAAPAMEDVILRAYELEEEAEEGAEQGALPSAPFLYYSWRALKKVVRPDKQKYSSGPVSFTSTFKDECGNSASRNTVTNGTRVAHLDVTTPAVPAGYPRVDTIGGKFFTFSVALSEPGYVEYFVSNCTEGPGYGEQVNVTGHIKVVQGTTPTDEWVYAAEIGGLTEEKTYCVALTECDIHRNCKGGELKHRDESGTELANFTVTTRDVTGPKFIAGLPYVDLIRVTTTTLHVELDEPGVAYYVVGACSDVSQPFADMTTSQAVIDAATGTAPGWAVARGSINVPAELSPVFANLTGLTQDTSYCAHVAAHDDQTPPNNMKDENKAVVFFHTADGIAPTITDVSMTSSDVLISGFRNATWGDVLTVTFDASEPITTPLVELALREGVTMDDVAAANEGCEEDPEKDCATVEVTGEAGTYTATFRGWQQHMQTGFVGFRVYHFVDFAPFGAAREAYPEAIFWTPNVGVERTTLSAGQAPVYLDLTPPIITAVEAVSNNTKRGDKAAGINDLVTATFTADEPIRKPTVTINGRSIPVADIIGGDGTSQSQKVWVAKCVMPAGPEQDVPLELTAVPTDVMGNVGDEVTESLMAVPLILDLRRPQLLAAALTCGNAVSKYYCTPGQQLTLVFSFTESIAAPSVTIAGNAVAAEGAGMNWTATATIKAGDQRDGLVTFEIANVEDTIAGNAAAVAKYTQVVPATLKVLFDSTAPFVNVRASSDNANDVQVARPGNTVTLRIEASEMITRPSVMIANFPADSVVPVAVGYTHRRYPITTFTPPDPEDDRGVSLMWVAKRTVHAGDQPPGDIVFEVGDFEDLPGNAGTSAAAPVCVDFFPGCVVAKNLMGPEALALVPTLAAGEQPTPARTYDPAGAAAPDDSTGWGYNIPLRSGVATAAALSEEARDEMLTRAGQIRPGAAMRYLAEYDQLADFFWQRGGPCSFFNAHSCLATCNLCLTDNVLFDPVPPAVSAVDVSSSNSGSAGLLARVGDVITVTVTLNETSTQPIIYIAGKRIDPIAAVAAVQPAEFLPSQPTAPDCANVNFAGDGYCDSVNNYAPCWDGGDCCPDTCRGPNCGQGGGFICDDASVDPIFSSWVPGTWRDYQEGMDASLEYSLTWTATLTVDDDTASIEEAIAAAEADVEALAEYVTFLNGEGLEDAAEVAQLDLQAAQAALNLLEEDFVNAGIPPEGRVAVRVFTFFDYATNLGIPAGAEGSFGFGSGSGPEEVEFEYVLSDVVIDYTPPKVSNSTMSSRNYNNDKWVATGGTVDLYFNTSEPICNPKVSINGRAADVVIPLGNPVRDPTAACPGYSAWRAERGMDEKDRDGLPGADPDYNLATADPVPFLIEMEDLAGNEGEASTLTEFPDPEVVKWDELQPVLITLLIASSNDNDRYCRDGQNVTLLMVADIPIQAPEVWVANEGKRIPIEQLKQLGPATWEGVMELQKGDQDEGFVLFAVNVTASERAGLRGCCEYTTTLLQVEGETTLPPGVILDTIPPTTLELRALSNSVLDNKKADAGFVVTATFTASEPLRGPSPNDELQAYIAGAKIGTSCEGFGCLLGGSASWRANHTVTEAEVGTGGDPVPLRFVFSDIAGNPGVDATQVVGADNVPVVWREDTALSVTRAVLWSNNGLSNAIAKPGDTLYFALEFSMPVSAPSVRLGKAELNPALWVPVSPTAGFAAAWNLELVADGNDFDEGVIPWVVTYADELGNAGPQLADQVLPEDETPPQVIFDKTAPVLIKVFMFSDSGVESSPHGDIATAGNVVTLQMDASEPIKKPRVWVGGREVPPGSVVGAEEEWDATIVVAATDEVDAAGNLTLRVEYLDLVDTAGIPATSPIDSPPAVFLDVEPPIFTSSTPAAVAELATSIEVSAEFNEPASVFAVAVPRGSTAPTAANVFALVGSGGSGAIATATAVLPNGKEVRPPPGGASAVTTLVFSALEPSTGYDIWLVAHDRLGQTSFNSQPTPTLLARATSGVLVTPKALTVYEDASEPNAVASFALSLTSAPAGPVTVATSIAAAFQGQLTFQPNSGAASASLSATFTPGNWDTPQNVDVVAVDDAIVEGAHQVIVSFTSASSGDVRYSGIPVSPVTVSVVDNDGADIIVTPNVRVLENETVAIFVSLGTAPPGDDEVVVTLTAGDKDLFGLTPTSSDGGPPMLIFSAANYNQPQAAIVRPVVDDVANDDRLTFVTVEVASTAALYNNVAVPDTIVTIVDINRPLVIARVDGEPDQTGWEAIEDPGHNPPQLVISATKAGNFSCLLGSSPVATVEVRFGVIKDTAGSDVYGQLTFTPPYVTFDFSNWDQPVLVTVEPVDDGVDFGDVEVGISFSASSIGTAGDPKYDGIVPTPALAALVQENNAARIIATDDQGLALLEIRVPEGQSVTYRVFPSTIPTGTITVTPLIPPKSQDQDHTLVASPASFSFGPTNVAPVVVTLTSAEDDIPQDPRDTDIGIRHRVAGADPKYAGLGDGAYDLPAIVADNDAGELILYPTPVNLNEPRVVGRPGVAVAVSVVLTAKPSHSVFVTFTPSQAGQVVFTEGKEITFTPQDFASPQSFSIYARQDGIDEGTHNITVCGVMSTQDVNYLEKAAVCLPVTIEDSKMTDEQQACGGGTRVFTDSGYGVFVPEGASPWPECLRITAIETPEDDLDGGTLPSPLAFAIRSSYLNVTARVENTLEELSEFPAPVHILFSQYIKNSYLNITEGNYTYALFNPNPFDPSNTWTIYQRYIDPDMVAVPSIYTGFYVLAEIKPVVDLSTAQLDVKTYIEQTPAVKLLPEISLDGIAGLDKYDPVLSQVRMTLDLETVFADDQLAVGDVAPEDQVKLEDCYVDQGGCVIDGITLTFDPLTYELVLSPAPVARRRRRLLQDSDFPQAGFSNADGSAVVDPNSLPTLGEYTTAINAISFINPSKNITADTRQYDLVLEEPFTAEPVVLGFPVYVIPINDPPNVTVTPAVVLYTEHENARPIEPDVTLYDVDNTHLTVASITLDPQFVPEDRLVFNMSVYRAALAARGEPEPEGLGEITVVQSAALGRHIEFRGAAPVATYEALLRQVKFYNDGPKVLNTRRVATFRVMDGELYNVIPATKEIIITPINDPPVALRQPVLNVPEGGVGIGQLVAADPEELEIVFSIMCSASKGRFQLLDPALGTYRYEAFPGINGIDKFVFLAEDQGGERSRMTEVVVQIGSRNNAPVAENMTITVWETVPQTGNLTATDLDGDHDVQFFRIVQEPAVASSLVIQDEIPSLFRSTSPGNFTYNLTSNNPVVLAASAVMDTMPASTDWNLLAGTSRHPGYHADVFKYVAVDASRVPSNEAFVHVNIRLLRENNTAPKALDMDIVVPEGETMVFKYNSSDKESPRHLVHMLVGPPADLGSVSSQGYEFQYRPKKHYNGMDLIQYEVYDAQGEVSNVGNISIHVTPVNGPPVPACGGAASLDLSLGVSSAIGDRTDAFRTVSMRLERALGRVRELPPKRFVDTSAFEDEVSALHELARGGAVFNISCGYPAAGVRFVPMGGEIAFALLALDVDAPGTGAKGRGQNISYHIVSPPSGGSVYEASISPTSGQIVRGAKILSDRVAVPPPGLVIVDLADQRRGSYTLTWTASDSDGLRMPKPVDVPFDISCAPGYVVNFTDQQRQTCGPCPAGSINSETEYDQEECFPCPPGSHAPFEGMVGCLISPENTFAPDFGMVTATSCPVNMIANRGGKVLQDCRCDRGFWQVNDTYCGRCPEDRSTCDSVGQELPRPKDGFWVDPEDGFRVMECVPLEACVALPTVADVRANVCGPEEVLPGEVPTGVAPYSGARCSKCSKGYFRGAGKCVQCEDNAEVVFYICLFVPIILFLAIIRLCQMGAGFGAVNILMTWAQINASFRYFDVGWPERVLTWFRILSITNFNIELAQPECTIEGWNYTTKFAVAHSVMLVWVILAALYLLGSYIRIKYKHSKRIQDNGGEETDKAERPNESEQANILRGGSVGSGNFDKLLTEGESGGESANGERKDRAEVIHVIRVLASALLLSMSWGYSFLTEMTFEYFDCKSADGHNWLYSGPEYDCFAYSNPNKHTYLMPLALFGLLAYTIGVFGLFAFILYRYRPTGPRPRIGEQRRTIARFGHVRDEETKKRLAHYRVLFGWLYKNYQMETFYHELVNLIKKGMIIITKVLMPNVPAQLLVNMGVLFATTLDVYSEQPFDSPALDRMEMISSMSNLFVLLCGFLYYVDIWTVAEYEILTNVLTAFLMVSFVVLCFLMILEMVPWAKRLVTAILKVAKSALADAMAKEAKEGENEDGMPRSVFLFHWENKFRQLLVKITSHKKFDSILMFLILLSSIASILGDQDVPEDVKDVCAYLDMIFTFVFLSECVMKVIALGFVLHKGAYLRDAFNCLDFFIVCVALLSLLGSLGVSWVKNLRMLRYLRFLRLRYLRVLRLVLRVAKEHGPAIMEEVRRQDSKKVVQVMAKANTMFDRKVQGPIHAALRADVDGKTHDHTYEMLQGMYIASGVGEGPLRKDGDREKWLKTIMLDDMVESVMGWHGTVANSEESERFWEWVERLANKVAFDKGKDWAVEPDADWTPGGRPWNAIEWPSIGEGPPYIPRKSNEMVRMPGTTARLEGVAEENGNGNGNGNGNDFDRLSGTSWEVAIPPGGRGDSFVDVRSHMLNPSPPRGSPPRDPAPRSGNALQLPPSSSERHTGQGPGGKGGNGELAGLVAMVDQPPARASGATIVNSMHASMFNGRKTSAGSVGEAYRSDSSADPQATRAQNLQAYSNYSHFSTTGDHRSRKPSGPSASPVMESAGNFAFLSQSPSSSLLPSALARLARPLSIGHTPVEAISVPTGYPDFPSVGTSSSTDVEGEGAADGGSGSGSGSGLPPTPTGRLSGAQYMRAVRDMRYSEGFMPGTVTLPGDSKDLHLDTNV